MSLVSKDDYLTIFSNEEISKLEKIVSKSMDVTKDRYETFELILSEIDVRVHENIVNRSQKYPDLYKMLEGCQDKKILYLLSLKLYAYILSYEYI